MAVPPPVLRFWRALDAVVGTVRPTRWGAVVTDARFPAIWDANYARIDRPASELTAEEVERELLPALAAVGAEVEHVVALEAETAYPVLTDLSTRGHHLAWDLVMTVRREDSAAAWPSAVQIREANRDDARTWRDVRSLLAESFGFEPGDPLEQLVRLERDVLARAGKRWFGVRSAGRWVSLAAVLVLEGVGYVDNVATEPAFQRRGYATAAAARATSIAFADGAEEVFLLADPNEPWTGQMYGRLGFRGVTRIGSTRGPVPNRRS